MANLVAWSEDDSKRIANTVKVVERGALEHPFYRARWPIEAGGDDVVLMVSAETEKVLGPPNASAAGASVGDITGVYPRGDACIVPRGLRDIPATETVDTETTYQVDFVHFPNLVFPADALAYESPFTFWAVARTATGQDSPNPLNVKYFAVSGGSAMFDGTIAAQVSGTTYDVTPSDAFNVTGTANDVLCHALFDEVFVVGQEVVVSMIGTKPYIVNAACPPTE